MICHICGAQRRANVRFCGQCGGELRPMDPNPDNLGPESQSLHPLGQLAIALADLDLVPRRVVDTARALADDAAHTGHRTLILSEHGRDLTEFLNRLLGEPVLPVTRHGLPVLTRIEWGTDAGPQSVPADKSVLRRPILILRSTTLIAGPLMNRPDDAEKWVLRETVQSDLLVICLSVGQLLSESEVTLINDVLLPLTPAPIGLALMGLDQIDSPDDRRELRHRVLSHVATGPWADRVAVYAINDPDEPCGLDALKSRIIADAAARARNEHQVRTTRVEHLLAHVERVLLAMAQPPSDSSSPVIDLHAILRREHELALVEAISHLRAGLADLRLGLSQRFDALSASQVRHEGFGKLSEQVLTMARDAAQAYVNLLQQSLQSDGPARLRIIGERLAPGQAGKTVHLPSTPMIGEAQPTPDFRTVALGGAGMAMVLLGRKLWTRIAGSVAILGAGQLRRTRAREVNHWTREMAGTASHDWLDTAEPFLVELLRTEASLMLEELGAALPTGKEVLQPVPPSQIESARRLVRACREATAKEGVAS